ncbi:MAG: flagellar hook-length control protein FliK [Cellulosilyticaceae bacterium]
MNNTLFTQQAALTDDMKAAFVKSQIAFISQLKIGDILDGKIVKTDHLQMFLQLKNGMHLNVELEKFLANNEWMTFEVKDIINEKIIIEQTHPLETPKEDIKNKAIHSLQLPNTKEMIECVDAFISKELPLEREKLMKTYMLHKEQTIPVHVLTNLIEKCQKESIQLLKLLANYEHQSMHQLVDKVKLLLFKDTNNTNMQTINNYKLLLQTLEPMLPINMRDEVKQFCKEQDFSEKSLSILKEYTKNLYETIFKLDTKQGIIQISKQADIKDNILFSCDEKLSKCIKIADKMVISTETREEINMLKEQLTIQTKIQDIGQYYNYPIQLKKEEGEAQVYFYKPKNKNKKNKRDYYAVIALDLPNIQTVDVHIHKIEEQISVDFYLENTEIMKLVQSNLYKLQEKLCDTEQVVTSWGCHIKENPNEKIKSMCINDIKGFDIKI